MTHDIRRISSGSSFETFAGYSRAIVDNVYIHLSGTTGFDYATMTIADDLVAQTHRCFANIAEALREADASLDDVVRVRYLLVDAADFRLSHRSSVTTSRSRVRPRPRWSSD